MRKKAKVRTMQKVLKPYPMFDRNIVRIFGVPALVSTNTGVGDKAELDNSSHISKTQEDITAKKGHVVLKKTTEKA